ncbi:MAG: DNA-directed RNA polymerase subunit beta, partial [Clostridia bacterium]|nr:DNA-directed RNA polymerase subunit beta [Clostridia bacterium]
MAQDIRTIKCGTHERKTFSKTKDVLQLPNLIEVQKDSYKAFIEHGIAEVFEDFSPIEDFAGHFRLDFLDHHIDETPKYSEAECRLRDATFAAPLRLNVRLTNKNTGEVAEEEVFMGEFPCMTDTGSFIINGAERVIVSQLVRSPGIYCKITPDKNGKNGYNTQVIPSRGAWLEFDHDPDGDILYVHIDRNRKLPATILLRAIGLSSNEEINSVFYNDPTILSTYTNDVT